jgi:hypothetical protein
MTPWKYTDQSRTVANRTLDNGGTESRFVSQITDAIADPDAPTKSQAKATA